jgi:inward rectifier potassium channel
MARVKSAKFAFQDENRRYMSIKKTYKDRLRERQEVIRAKILDNTGFSTNTAAEGSRLSNRDGSYNVRKTGVPFLERYSAMHTLLSMKGRHFVALAFGYYFLLNTVFALLYYMIGIEELSGIDYQSGEMSDFMQAFFFSAQTLTTVGYGHVHPTGLTANSLAAVESLTGILTFAVFTGLIYARFSQPRAHLIFSDNAIIAPHKGGRALMFRLASARNNNLTDVTVQAVVAIHTGEGSGAATRFYNLPTEISRINTLITSWTVVHVIDENSPLNGLESKELSEKRAEVLIQINGLDDQLFVTVQQKTSYIADEIVCNARFIPMISRSRDGKKTIVDLGKLSSYQLLNEA